MAATRTLLEDAIVAALVPLLKPAKGGDAGGYLSAVKPWQGSLSPADDDPDISRILNGQTPAVLVTTGDGTYSRPTMARRYTDLDLTVDLLVISSNLRSQEAKARGDGFSGDPGIYQILEDVRDRLMMIELGVDGVGFLQPERETVISRGDKSIWLASYAAPTDVEAVDPTANDPDLLTVRSNINNPDDDAADPVITQDTVL